MLLALQLGLYCLMYILLVKCAVGSSGRNCLYFYPKAYMEEAQRRGIANVDEVMKKGKRFMIPFCAAVFVAPVLVISLWNRVTDFKTAYLQAALFFVVVNWFDALAIDRLWVGHSAIWKIRGMEGVPYVKPWKSILIKRSLATAMYLIIALAAAGLVVLAGRLL
ncbi:MAG: hypothetical protein Q4E18_15555 [Clostridia bacterium]|nr:hypothetical protein [Clostridia bacterium]